MLKSLTLLFLASFMAPAATNMAESFNRVLEPEFVLNEDENPDVLHGYTYEDTYASDGTLYRTFDTDELTPVAVRSFCKPSGYIFHLDAEEANVREMVDQIVFAGSNLTFLELSIGYKLSGSTVNVSRELMPTFSPSTPIEDRCASVTQLFMVRLEGCELFKTLNAGSEFTITPVVDVRFRVASTGNFGYTIFNGKSVTTNPYNEKDFISLSAAFAKSDFSHSGNLALSVISSDDFFCEAPNYNEFGWHTDTTIDLGDGEYCADYTFSIYAFGDVPIALDLQCTKMVQLTIPEEELPVKAVIKFVSEGTEYTLESKTLILRDPDYNMTIDGYADRSAVQRNATHTFGLSIDGLIKEEIVEAKVDVKVVPYRLSDKEIGHELYDNPVLPSTGVEGNYYYIPTSDEIDLYNAGNIGELNNKKAEGQYYIYKDGSFAEYESESIISQDYDIEDDGPINPSELLTKDMSIPYNGKWQISINDTRFATKSISYYVNNYIQNLDVFSEGSDKDEIIFNVPDETNLLLGAGSIDIKPTITTASGLSGEYYFEYELSKQGVVEITQGENGILNVEPIHAGLVNLRLDVESSLFPKMSKQISIRVLDGAYDSSTIEVADEFHKAGQDLNVALNVRGFTNIQNLDVTWKIVNKKKVVLPPEKIEKHSDATMTFKAPETGDYTISAFIDGIEVAKLTVEIRYVDMNNFLRMNIWWIVITTLGLVFLMIFFFTITKRSKSTVDRIERVYGVYCQCISNDTLTEPELKRIKREITRCLHHCEDLNIEAFNQYEKSTRYLRKSLMDTKVLMEKYSDLTPEQKGVLYENLNRDLGKALNVAKEIEAAKNMSEQYHSQANRQNFEVVKEDKPKKNKKDK